MPKFLIERQLPGAGALPAGDLQNISKTSVGVLTEMGPSIQWVQSFVTPDAIFCVYIAPDEDAIREHGRRGRFPVTRISRIMGIIDPTTAEGPPTEADAELLNVVRTGC
jgi:hypothetical protein